MFGKKKKAISADSEAVTICGSDTVVKGCEVAVADIEISEFHSRPVIYADEAIMKRVIKYLQCECLCGNITPSHAIWGDVQALIALL